MVDPGTLGVRLEYPLVHDKAPCPHMLTLTSRGNVVLSVHLPAYFWEMRGNRRPRGNPGVHGENMQYFAKTVTEAQGPWGCEAAILTGTPLCYPK